MSRRRVRRKEEPVQSNWLTTYSDLVTLLMCFFVLMFSFSTVDAAKFRQVAISLQTALRGVLDGGVSLGPQDILEKLDLEEQLMEDAFHEIEAYIQEAGLKGAVVAVYEERGLVIRFLDTVLFDLAKANLRADSLAILDRVAQVLDKVPNQIAIEGHTDNLPIQTQEFPSNWWLSTARANRVVEYFAKQHGITPKRLSAVGYGEYRPLLPNSSADNRAQNRRVEILIKKSTLGDLEPN